MRHQHAESGRVWRGRGERWRRLSIPARIGIIAAIIVAAAGFFVLAGFIVVWLWNWLMPMIFRLPTIGFWEAWGLLILSSILFKGHASSASRMTREQRRKRALRERLRDIGGEEEGGPTEAGPGPGGTEPAPG